VDGVQKTCIILKDNGREELIPCCPFCNSEDAIKYGEQRNKVQRYRCNICHKTFNEKYGTLFYGWLAYDPKHKYVIDFVIGKTITTALIDNLNSFIQDSAPYIRRRSKRLVRFLDWMVDILKGYFFLHNYLKAHWGLSKRDSKNWVKHGVTPAMACGITFTQFSLFEILIFHQL